MRDSADTARATDRRIPAMPAAGPMHQVGMYLTDEVFLYRVADVRAIPAGEIVDLEDCYGLDLVRVPARDLSARRLRVVTPASSRG